MEATKKELLDTYNTLRQIEGTLWGELMFGRSKFRQAHNILDIRVKGAMEAMEKLEKKYFQMEDGEIQYDEIPAEKEGDKPTKKPRMNGELTAEQYEEEMQILLSTKISL